MLQNNAKPIWQMTIQIHLPLQICIYPIIIAPQMLLILVPKPCSNDIFVVKHLSFHNIPCIKKLNLPHLSANSKVPKHNQNYFTTMIHATKISFKTINTKQKKTSKYGANKAFNTKNYFVTMLIKVKGHKIQSEKKNLTFLTL